MAEPGNSNSEGVISSSTAASMLARRNEDKLALPKIQESLANNTPEQIARRFQAEMRTRQRLEKKIVRLRDLAYKDTTTGIGNKRFFNDTLAEEVKIAKEDSSLSLSLAIYDLDDFGLFNKKFGPQVGDEVLGSVGATMERSVRPQDATALIDGEREQTSIGKPARVGGEELGIILPGYPPADDGEFHDENSKTPAGIHPAERVRANIEKMELKNGGRITASGGVTQLYPDDTPETFYKRAAVAQAAAKKAGKNRIFMAFKGNNPNSLICQDVTHNETYNVTLLPTGEINQVTKVS